MSPHRPHHYHHPSKSDKATFYRFMFLVYISVFLLAVFFFIPYDYIIQILVPFFLGLGCIVFGEQIEEVKRYEIDDTYEAKQIATFNLYVGKVLQLFGLVLIIISIIKVTTL